MAKKLTKGQTRELSGNNPRLKLNLKEIFGVDVASESLRLALAEALLDKMIRKTQDGKSRTGHGFRGYSKAYRDSDAYKAAGKTGKVNMTLSGDMLGLIDVTSESENTVTLGWEDDDEGAKAHGHITGGGHLPVRDFFGLNDTDIKQVRAEFADELEELKVSDDMNEAILSFIRKLDGES